MMTGQAASRRACGVATLVGTSILVLAAVAPGNGAAVSQSSTGLLLIASMQESMVDIIDETTWETVASLPTGPRPHEVRMAPDGESAYVVAGRTITAIDVGRRAVRATFDLGEHSAHDVRVSRDGRTLWAACAGTQTVLELEARTGAVTHRYQTLREGAWFVEVSPDGTRLYTPNLEGKSVSVITRATGSTVVLPLEHQAYGIDVTPDGRQLWVSGRGLVVFDTSTDRVVRTDMPQLDTGRLRITPDGQRVIVATGQTLSVVDRASGRIERDVALPAASKVLALSGDGRRAFVTNPEAHSASVVDLVSGQVSRTFPTRRQPDGIAWAPRRPA